MKNPGKPITLDARVDEEVAGLPFRLDADDFASFVLTLEAALTTYGVQNAKYDNGWKDDGLDVRATFAELNAKLFRLRNLVWKRYDDFTQDSDLRSKTGETIQDSIVYLLFLWRRIELEFGDFDEEQVKKERDKS